MELSRLGLTVDVGRENSYNPRVLRCLEESCRLEEAWQEDRNRRRIAEAISAGFSSFEEYFSDLMKKDEELHNAAEKRMKEIAALSGKTVGELWAEHPQRGVSQPLMPQCDCDGKQQPLK